MIWRAAYAASIALFALCAGVAGLPPARVKNVEFCTADLCFTNPMPLDLTVITPHAAAQATIGMMIMQQQGDDDPLMRVCQTPADVWEFNVIIADVPAWFTCEGGA